MEDILDVMRSQIISLVVGLLDFATTMTGVVNDRLEILALIRVDKRGDAKCTTAVVGTVLDIIELAHTCQLFCFLGDLVLTNHASWVGHLLLELIGVFAGIMVVGLCFSLELDKKLDLGG